MWPLGIANVFFLLELSVKKCRVFYQGKHKIQYVFDTGLLEFKTGNCESIDFNQFCYATVRYVFRPSLSVEGLRGLGIQVHAS